MVSSFNVAETCYVITGALAVSYYGKPRTTMDIDIIVQVLPEDLQTKLVTPLKNVGFQVNKEKIRKALESSYKILTVKDKMTPFTLDIIFSNRKLEKKTGTILGLPTFYQKPENLVLAKLRMIKVTIPREKALKDKEDIKAIIKYTKIDMKTLTRKAEKEKTITILKSIINR